MVIEKVIVQQASNAMIEYEKVTAIQPLSLIG